MQICDNGRDKAHQEATIPEANAERKRLSGLPGLLVIAALLPAASWLRFGVVDGFAIGFTVFLVMLAAAVEYLPRAADVATATGAGRPSIRGRWYDKLGLVWMLSIPFAPFLSWVLTSAIDVDAGNWWWLLGFRAIFCVAVPAICVLPLLRYVRRGTAGIALAILAIGTGFPVATGIGSAYDLVRGPAWQAVTITDIRDVDFTTGTGTRVHAGGVQVELADGRTLSRSPGVPLRPGLANVLVLRGFGRIIGAR